MNMIRLLKRRPIVPTRPAFYSTSRRAMDKAVPNGGSANGSTQTSSSSSSPNDPVELLYKMSQKSTVIVMMGVTGVSAMYWSSILASTILFEGKMYGDIDLGGDPTWGYYGLAATAAFLYCSRRFAHQTVYQAYLSADKRRLGFQMHNIFGQPGRKIEVSLGKARFTDPKMTAERVLSEGGMKGYIGSSSLVPVQVEGIQGNILLDQDGLKQHNQKLMHLLLDPNGARLDSKEVRTEKVKAYYRDMRQKRR